MILLPNQLLSQTSKSAIAIPVGVIDNFSSSVKLRSKVSGKVTLLRPKLDFGKLLYAGDELSLSPAASVRFTIGLRQTLLKGPKKGYPIPNSSMIGSRYTAAMRMYAREGGLPRAATSSIYRPSPDSVVRSERFSLNWIPNVAVAHGTATITNGPSTIWSGVINPASGQAADLEMITAIRQAQSRDTQTSLSFRLEFEDGFHEDSGFKLLSQKDEETVAADLANADRLAIGIPRGLLRAKIMHDAGLLNDAADELEKTIQLAPEGIQLLKDALAAELEVGNLIRGQVIYLRLPPSERPKGVF